MIPPYLEKYALEALSRELAHRSHVNAAAGYMVHEGVPWPEVFERPGWKVEYRPVGEREFVVAAQRRPSQMATPGGDPPDWIELRTESVRPLVVAGVSGGWRVALGVSEFQRRYFVFRWRVR